MSRVPEMFGSLSFNETVMRDRLPKDIFRALKKTMEEGSPLAPGVANVVASVMKDWAIEHGATHFTHWFQPMTGVTAEKHDSFLSPQGDGSVIMEFSGKELTKGEPDASSFPSGGLRATFEARGYTAWDPTSYAFIKDKTLCIPTAFCSYGGEALDQKTPLLRSMETLSKQAVRVLKLFGRTDATRVTPTVGPEQEYFLVDKKYFDQRMDLIFTGRTLYGAKPPKGQELEDHYFGSIKPRVQAFMTELNEELWKLGVLAKTEHNEVAPAQHELAPVFSVTNVAADHNQLTMEMMKKVAQRHGLVCLLHEKPFAGVNGSGKHNNWSMSTNTGYNLLEPGDSPHESAQFLLFLTAVIKAVDDYQDLLRVAVASAGNDHRLGANEAPPAIISVYLGDMLTDVIDTIMNGVTHKPGRTSMEIGVSSLPPLPVDLSDRNRTSPFAFTGNKFEFRAVGSSQSIAPVNIALNTAMACALDDIATELEATVGSGTSLNAALQELLPRLFREHQAVVFNGNGYSEEWPVEAARRGLPNLATTVDALERYNTPEVMDVFLRQNVLSEREMLARQEILLDTYAKTIAIEASLMLDMSRTQILPVALQEQAAAADLVLKTRAVSTEAAMEEERFTSLRGHTVGLSCALSALEQQLAALRAAADAHTAARIARDGVVPAMQACREHCDALERMLNAAVWPLPSYAEMLWLH